jgi:hypothetical protein
MGLKILCTWFNELEHEKQMMCIEFMNEKGKNIKELSEEEFNKLYDFWVQVKKLVQEKKNEEKVLEQLRKCGLEKIAANSFYKFCLKISFPELDANLLDEIEDKQFEPIVKFIINNTLLYSDFKEKKFQEFMELGKFKSEEDAKRVLRFLRDNFLNVIKRETSLSLLIEELKNRYNVAEEKANIIKNNLEKNINDLQMSYIIRSITNIKERIDQIENLVEEKEE